MGITHTVVTGPLRFMGRGRRPQVLMEESQCHMVRMYVMRDAGVTTLSLTIFFSDKLMQNKCPWEYPLSLYLDLILLNKFTIYKCSINMY